MFLLKMLLGKVTIYKKKCFLPFMIVYRFFENSVFALVFDNMKVLQYGWKCNIYFDMYLFISGFMAVALIKLPTGCMDEELGTDKKTGCVSGGSSARVKFFILCSNDLFSDR